MQKLTKLSTEYAKYMKGAAFKEINALISRELKPLEQLVISSTSIDYFDEKKTKGETIPTFRIEAAKELFIKSLDEVCQILLFCKIIERPLDTAVLLKRFEIPNWQHVRPFEFYLTQLKIKFAAFKKSLSDMHKVGRSTLYSMRLTLGRPLVL